MKFCIIVFALFIVCGISFADDCIITSYDQVENVLKKCTNVEIKDLEVPAGQTLRIQPLEDTTIQISGNISFAYKAWEGPLIQINATGLKMFGTAGSVFDGHGPLYWDGLGEWGTLKPHFVFITAENSEFRHLEFLNSPRYFILLSDSKNVTFSDLTLNNLAGDEERAGANHAGHNSDGFDVFNGTDITFENSRVYNQDDCVALRHGSNIHINNVYCHGGHGLSLSVGFSNITIEENMLSDVVIENCELFFGQNAIHIKTHSDATNGSVSNVTYRNIWFQGQTSYGINIQQNYANVPPGQSQPKESKDNIPITGLTFEDVSGSVHQKAKGVHINCADKACVDWNWKDVNVQGGTNDCNFTPNGFEC